MLWIRRRFPAPRLRFHDMITRTKLFLRQVAPGYYRLVLDRYVRARRFTRHWRRILIRLNQHRNGDIFAIELNISAGFFAVITSYLYILVHCEINNLTPYILVTGDSYLSPGHDPNWINNYFDVNTPLTAAQAARIARGRMKVTKIKSIQDLGYNKKYKQHLTIEHAHKLMSRHLVVKNDIMAAVDAFFSNYMPIGPILGLHYRGTDKFAEAPRLAYDVFFKKVAEFIASAPHIQHIFLATDEPELLDYLQKHPLPRPVVTWASSQTFRGGTAAHYAKKADKYVLGREALLTCLALARCDYCLRTASFLSGYASVFNPRLRTTLLNAIYYDSFPDRELWERQSHRTAPLPAAEQPAVDVA